jgi:hypothetical protein
MLVSHHIWIKFPALKSPGRIPQMSHIDWIQTCRDGQVVVARVAGEYALLAAKPIRAGETLF